MNVLNRYNVFIDSSQRITGNPNYFTVNLKKPFALTTDHSYFKCKIGSAEIPFCFKQVNSTNNTIYARYQRPNNNIDHSFYFTIANGNYNILTLLTEIKTRLKDFIETNYGVMLTFEFTYDRSTSHASFKISGTDNVETIITLKWSQNLLLGEMVGFVSDAVFYYDGSNNSTSVSSTQSVNVNPVTAIYIRSDTLIQTQNYESLIEKDVISDILCKIQLTTQPNTYILYDGGLDLNITLTNKIIDTISLYLSTNKAYDLDLGGLDWSCRITIEEVDAPELKHNYTIDNTANPEMISNLENQKSKLIGDLQRIKSNLLEKINK
jgi:hypothetical protein